MINLKAVSGLPLQFDKDELLFDSDLDSQGKATISLDNIRGELLNKSLSCPDHICNTYIQIDQKGVLKQRKLRYDVVVMQPNLAGIEYVKTKGHYNDLVTSKDSLPEIVEVLSGWLTVLLQRPRVKPSQNGSGWTSVTDMFDFNRLEDIIVIRLKKSDKLVIPSGWGHVFINTRQVPVIYGMLRNSDEFTVRRFIPEQGAGYYLIRKNARQEVVRNPNYKIVPKHRKGDTKFVLKELGITEKTPIVKQVIRKSERFSWLQKPGMVNWNKIIQAYLTN